MANFNYFILIILYLNTMKAEIEEGEKFFTDRIIEPDSHSSNDIRLPKGLIVFIDKLFLTEWNPNNQIQNKDNKYALEPYKSLQMSPAHEDLNEVKIRGSTDVFHKVVEGLKLTKTQSEMLRKKWNSSCDKKAAKLCRKACKKSHKVVCSTLRCTRQIKRRYKFECAKNCNKIFKR